jgi:hypothetical protein
LVALRGFLVFAGVFEGGFGKTGVSWWCFCGQRVVNCVVDDGLWMTSFQGWKFCGFLNFIFGGRRLRLKTTLGAADTAFSSEAAVAQTLFAESFYIDLTGSSPSLHDLQCILVH